MQGACTVWICIRRSSLLGSKNNGVLEIIKAFRGPGNGRLCKPNNMRKVKARAGCQKLCKNAQNLSGHAIAASCMKNIIQPLEDMWAGQNGYMWNHRLGLSKMPYVIRKVSQGAKLYRAKCQRSQQNAAGHAKMASSLYHRLGLSKMPKVTQDGKMPEVPHGVTVKQQSEFSNDQKRKPLDVFFFRGYTPGFPAGM